MPSQAIHHRGLHGEGRRKRKKQTLADGLDTAVIRFTGETKQGHHVKDGTRASILLQHGGAMGACENGVCSQNGELSYRTLILASIVSAGWQRMTRSSLRERRINDKPGEPSIFSRTIGSFWYSTCTPALPWLTWELWSTLSVKARMREKRTGARAQMMLGWTLQRSVRLNITLVMKNARRCGWKIAAEDKFVCCVSLETDTKQALTVCEALLWCTVISSRANPRWPSRNVSDECFERIVLG